MSATSSLARGNPRPSLRSLFAGLEVQLFEGFKRTGRIPDHLGGDFGVLGCGRQLGMAKLHLDDPHIRTCFQQVSCKTVPKRVQGCGFVDTGHALGRCKGPVQLAGRDRVDLGFAREHPPFGPRLASIVTQQVK